MNNLSKAIYQLYQASPEGKFVFDSLIELGGYHSIELPHNTEDLHFWLGKRSLAAIVYTGVNFNEEERNGTRW